MSQFNFQLIAKPTGSTCNLNCKYCFYSDKDYLYPNRGKNFIMDEVTLKKYVINQIKASTSDSVNFIWQGGEPMLAGIGFYKQALNLQKKYANGKKINNYFQTNGILINDKWAEFFKENNFFIGISLDGNKEQHDLYRKNFAGQGSFDKVIKAIEVLKKYRIEFNILCCVNDQNVKEPITLYEALKDTGATFFQFSPVVERHTEISDKNSIRFRLVSSEYTQKAKVTNWSVDPLSYGKFLNKIFDYWLANDFGKIFVMNFEQTLNQIIGGAGSCVFSKTCGAGLAIEANGDIYSCDHYVFKENLLMNINTNNLDSLNNNKEFISFVNNKYNSLSKACLSCPVLSICNGGCPKDRFIITAEGEKQNYLCEGYKLHFQYVKPKMEIILRKMNLLK